MAPSTKEILLGFIQGPDGEEWTKKQNGWSADSDDVCSWAGIKCTGDDVTEINLKDTDLTASFPSQLGKLKSLTHLHLASNNLFGDIPSDVAKLPNLIHVDLSSNKLRGSLPVFISSQLEFLNLSHNQFTGKLPRNIGDTGGTQLKVFDIKYNRLEGPIPSSIGKMKSSSTLMELDLSSNKLDGSIPKTIGNIKSLEGLFLSNNRLTGTIPASITRYDMSLSQIFLHGNALSGSLPVALADLPNLKNLFIDDNKLTGEVPNELCALKLNEVFFSAGQTMNVDVRGGDVDNDDDTPPNNDNNGIEVHGVIAPVVKDGTRRLTALSSGETRRMAYEYTGQRDGCNSIACPPGYYSGGNGKDGVFPCTQCHHDYLNPYLGANSCFVLDQYEIMSNFYYQTQGEQWNGEYQDWSSKTIPVCKWTGISCNQEGDIISIVLPSSDLKGQIPASLGFLRHLQILDLSQNLLSGEVPSDLHFAPLEVLDISGNLLRGFIPDKLCEKAGVNKNGEGGSFGCNRIACARGSYSPTGREGTEPCSPCSMPSATYIGATVCDGSVKAASSTSSFSSKATKIGIGILSVLLAGLVCFGFMLLAFFAVKRIRTHKRNRRGYNAGEYTPEMEEFTSPEDEIPSSYVSKTMPGPSADTMGGTFVLETASGGGGAGGGGDSSQPVSVQVKARNAWNSGKEATKEVWLDVPKIN